MNDPQKEEKDKVLEQRSRIEEMLRYEFLQFNKRLGNNRADFRSFSAGFGSAMIRLKDIITLTGGANANSDRSAGADTDTLPGQQSSSGN